MSVGIQEEALERMMDIEQRAQFEIKSKVKFSFRNRKEMAGRKI
jgi:hypothetical protein